MEEIVKEMKELEHITRYPFHHSKNRCTT
uniref:Uncharacterized protein n=1 Tax=Nelumbo nucifera TaxID=4432 RepID=A0A822YIG7_NELNU|nr:TPA_asm: hypothetical protein HUJ06_009940 [Nelumbo nucifera]